MLTFVFLHVFAYQCVPVVVVVVAHRFADGKWTCGGNDLVSKEIQSAVGDPLSPRACDL